MKNVAAKYILRLYVTGDTTNSQMAIRNLNSILENELKGFYALEVIDVLNNPERAIEDKILVTPTLIKISPQPVRRVIGNLSDREKVLSGLDLTAESGQLLSGKQNIFR